MLEPAEQVRQHQAQFQTRQMSAGAEMLALAEGDMFVRTARDIEPVRIVEDALDLSPCRYPRGELVSAGKEGRQA